MWNSLCLFKRLCDSDVPLNLPVVTTRNFPFWHFAFKEEQYCYIILIQLLNKKGSLLILFILEQDTENFMCIAKGMVSICHINSDY